LNFELITKLHINIRMATARPFFAQLSRTCLSSSRQISHNVRLLSTSATCAAARGANAAPIKSKRDKALGSSSNPQKNKKKGEEPKKKKKQNTMYNQPDMKQAEQFSLLEAMRLVFPVFLPTKYSEPF
jgi:large subunit ribosomal protein L1